MLRYLRAHHVAVLAVLVAVSGTAYAAGQVTGKEVKNKSIAGKDVKPKTLTAKLFKDGSLTGADLSDDSLTGADVDEAGLTGTRIVARLRTPAAQTIPAGMVGVPLTVDGSWTQRADEFDRITGQMRVNLPAGCNGPRGVSVAILRPNSQYPTALTGIAAVGSASSTSDAAETLTVPLGSAGVLGSSDHDGGEPGSDSVRTLKAVAFAGCEAGSTANQVVVTDIDLDVIGYR